MVGNVPLPTFFMSRTDIPQTRYWPRYYEDLDVVAWKNIPMAPSSTRARARQTPTAGVGLALLLPGHLDRAFTWPAHDFDDLDQGPSYGLELWVAFLPVGWGDPVATLRGLGRPAPAVPGQGARLLRRSRPLRARLLPCGQRSQHESPRRARSGRSGPERSTTTRSTRSAKAPARATRPATSGPRSRTTGRSRISSPTPGRCPGWARGGRARTCSCRT